MAQPESWYYYCV